MRIVIKCSNKPNEWCIVEVQGSVEPRKGEALDGQTLGEFSIRDVRKNTDFICHIHYNNYSNMISREKHFW